jgi:hypothetical protein
MSCSICADKLEENNSYIGDRHTPYEDKLLCEICYYESDPSAVVLYKNDDTPYIITDTRNETEGDFVTQWKSTDPWRGYYETRSKKYTRINSAELLAWHESEQVVKNFDDRIQELFDEHDIDYARIIARTSNVFYQNYDLYVKKDQAILGHLLVNKVKNEVDYYNPKWYRNILFDEESLEKLADLFPEKEIQTDHDAIKLIKDLGKDALDEIRDRVKEYRGEKWQDKK